LLFCNNEQEYFGILGKVVLLVINTTAICSQNHSLFLSTVLSTLDSSLAICMKVGSALAYALGLAVLGFNITFHVWNKLII